MRLRIIIAFMYFARGVDTLGDWLLAICTVVGAVLLSPVWLPVWLLAWLMGQVKLKHLPKKDREAVVAWVKEREQNHG